MKIARAPALLLMLIGQTVCAGGSSSVTIAVGYNAQAPAARMQMTAEYVAIPISIQNDARDAVRRSDEIEKALRAITEKLAVQPDLKAMHGVISLSGREQSKSFSSGGESYLGSAQLYVLGSLKPDTSVFSITKRVYQLVASTSPGDGTKITLGNTLLGIDEPEKYRGRILGLIAKSVGDARRSLGAVGAVDIDGLENPVSVMQLNDREVVLFINYRLRAQAKPL